MFFCSFFFFRFISYHAPFGVQRLSLYTTRGEAPSLVDGWDGLDGRSWKVSFKFLHTLWEYRTYIYIYISTHIRNKNCHQHSYGFQNLMSSWGWGNIIFEITLGTWVFKYLVPKVDGYQVQKKFVNDFLKISKTCHLSFGGGF